MQGNQSSQHSNLQIQSLLSPNTSSKISFNFQNLNPLRYCPQGTRQQPIPPVSLQQSFQMNNAVQSKQTVQFEDFQPPPQGQQATHSPQQLQIPSPTQLTHQPLQHQELVVNMASALHEHPLIYQQLLKGHQSFQSQQLLPVQMKQPMNIQNYVQYKQPVQLKNPDQHQLPKQIQQQMQSLSSTQYYRDNQQNVQQLVQNPHHEKINQTGPQQPVQYEQLNHLKQLTQQQLTVQHNQRLQLQEQEQIQHLKDLQIVQNQQQWNNKQVVQESEPKQQVQYYKPVQQTQAAVYNNINIQNEQHFLSNKTSKILIGSQPQKSTPDRSFKSNYMGAIATTSLSTYNEQWRPSNALVSCHYNDVDSDFSNQTNHARIQNTFSEEPIINSPTVHVAEHGFPSLEGMSVHKSHSAGDPVQVATAVKDSADHALHSVPLATPVKGQSEVTLKELCDLHKSLVDTRKCYLYRKREYKEKLKSFRASNCKRNVSLSNGQDLGSVQDGLSNSYKTGPPSVSTNIASNLQYPPPQTSGSIHGLQNLQAHNIHSREGNSMDLTHTANFQSQSNHENVPLINTGSEAQTNAASYKDGRQTKLNTQNNGTGNPGQTSVRSSTNSTPAVEYSQQNKFLSMFNQNYTLESATKNKNSTENTASHFPLSNQNTLTDQESCEDTSLLRLSHNKKPNEIPVQAGKRHTILLKSLTQLNDLCYSDNRNMVLCSNDKNNVLISSPVNCVSSSKPRTSSGTSLNANSAQQTANTFQQVDSSTNSGERHESLCQLRQRSPSDIIASKNPVPNVFIEPMENVSIQNHYYQKRPQPSRPLTKSSMSTENLEEMQRCPLSPGTSTERVSDTTGSDKQEDIESQIAFVNPLALSKANYPNEDQGKAFLRLEKFLGNQESHLDSLYKESSKNVITDITTLLETKCLPHQQTTAVARQQFTLEGNSFSLINDANAHQFPIPETCTTVESKQHLRKDTKWKKDNPIGDTLDNLNAMLSALQNKTSDTTSEPEHLQNEKHLNKSKVESKTDDFRNILNKNNSFSVIPNESENTSSTSEANYLDDCSPFASKQNIEKCHSFRIDSSERRMCDGATSNERDNDQNKLNLVACKKDLFSTSQANLLEGNALFTADQNSQESNQFMPTVSERDGSDSTSKEEDYGKHKGNLEDEEKDNAYTMRHKNHQADHTVFTSDENSNVGQLLKTIESDKDVGSSTCKEKQYEQQETVRDENINEANECTKETVTVPYVYTQLSELLIEFPYGLQPPGFKPIIKEKRKHQNKVLSKRYLTVDYMLSPVKDLTPTVCGVQEAGSQDQTSASKEQEKVQADSNFTVPLPGISSSEIEDLAGIQISVLNTVRTPTVCGLWQGDINGASIEGKSEKQTAMQPDSNLHLSLLDDSDSEIKDLAKELQISIIDKVPAPTVCGVHQVSTNEAPSEGQTVEQGKMQLDSNVLLPENFDSEIEDLTTELQITIVDNVSAPIDCGLQQMDTNKASTERDSKEQEKMQPGNHLDVLLPDISNFEIEELTKELQITIVDTVPTPTNCGFHQLGISEAPAEGNSEGQRDFQLDSNFNVSLPDISDPEIEVLTTDIKITVLDSDQICKLFPGASAQLFFDSNIGCPPKYGKYDQ